MCRVLHVCVVSGDGVCRRSSLLGPVYLLRGDCVAGLSSTLAAPQAHRGVYKTDAEVPSLLN